MGEVLTQSQIDALLAAANSGSMVEEKSSNDSTSNLRKYDFHTPKKFTKDRLKLISSVYENYARIITSYLTSLLRSSFNMELMDVEEQRYYEVNNALTETDIVSMIDTKLENSKEESNPVIMQFSNQVMHAMIDRMLGGSGILDESEEMEGYTEIEISLYESIVKHMVPVMKDAWQNYVNMQFTFNKIETSPKLLQSIGVDEIVVIVVFDVEFKETKGQLNLCLSGELVEDIFKAFDKLLEAGNKRKDIQNEKYPDAIFDNIRDTTLTIEAKLARSEILFSDMYHLNVGDIINLNKNKDSDIYLYIEDEPWFKGKLGVHKGNMAVKIMASAAKE